MSRPLATVVTASGGPTSAAAGGLMTRAPAATMPAARTEMVDLLCRMPAMVPSERQKPVWTKQCPLYIGSLTEPPERCRGRRQADASAAASSTRPAAATAAGRSCVCDGSVGLVKTNVR